MTLSPKVVADVASSASGQQRAAGRQVEAVGVDSGDQAEIRALVRTLIRDHASDQRVSRLDETETFDEEFYGHLGTAGLIGLGATTDEPADPRHEIVVLEELGATHTSMAVSVVVQYMGLRLMIGHARGQQRERLLDPLLRGSTRIAFALTEPDGGTDVARAMRTTARPADDGWVLNGRKTWISGAATSGHAIVLARTSAPTRSSIDGITMFLVPLSAPGITVRVLDTVSIHGVETCEVTLDEVRLGPKDVLGQVGSGFRQVLGTLNAERLNAAAAALGVARGALQAAVAYASQRHAFDRPIGSFQALQHKLADGAVQIEGARGLLARAAEAAHHELRNPKLSAAAETLSAMAKLAASEAAVAVTDTGMRVMGGAGLSREYSMQRYFRDARLWTFAPLTNEMLRNLVGERWLGLPRSY